MKKGSLIVMLAVALAASAATLLTERVVFHTPTAEAQDMSSPQNYSFTPQHRKDDHVDESFFFYNAKTGDIWVYQEDKPKEHYRVVAVGQKLEKLN